MAKGYWVVFYHAVKDQEKFAAYAKLASQAMAAVGARYILRGNPSKVYEHGENLRVVLIVFTSVAAAVELHDSPGYQAALKALGDAADRDIRIVEALE
jgi:uncharacterized protein (DUF1330 family)